MHFSATTLVLLAKIACFRPQQGLFSVPKRLVFRQKKGSFRRKSLSFATGTPLFGSAERPRTPFFFYFICKYFAIVLSVRQKRSVRFDFRHRPFPWPETDDSQAVGKSKCHFDKTVKASGTGTKKAAPTRGSSFLFYFKNWLRKIIQPTCRLNPAH